MAKTLEATLEPEVQTFKVWEPAPGQEYHYLHRVVGPTALPDGTITGDILDLEVMGWLQSGYRIHTIHTLGMHKGEDGNLRGYVYGYHLVKDAPVGDAYGPTASAK